MTDAPNFLLVSFDDCISYSHFRQVFGATLSTPNLDRISACSARFQSAYCQVPLCGPSRASFMSAQSPHQIGVLDHTTRVFDRIAPTDIWSYALKEAGYFCSSGGKVHHGYKPLRRRFHKLLYSDAQKDFGDDMRLPAGVARHRYGGIRGGWGTTNEADDDIYYDAKSANSAIEFLETYDKDQPFYREVGFFSPHGPRYTPARFKDMYDVDSFEMPEAWAEEFDETDYTTEFMPETSRLQRNEVAWWRANVRNYFAALSHGDYHLGRVWDALKSSRHAQNTIVIILSDHGFMLGGRRRFYKTTLWEPSLGVPLIVHDPKRDQGLDSTDPVALLDVGPTVMDYAGLPPIEKTVGTSLRPQVNGENRPDREVPSFRHNSASIRKGGFRFTSYGDGSTQLFDLESDPWNYHDLGPEHSAYEEMQTALVETCHLYNMPMRQTETSH